MPSVTRKKPISELTDAELVKSAWAFGIISGVIGTGWSSQAFGVEGWDAPSIGVRCFFVLGGLCAYGIGFAAIRQYRAELRRRRRK